MSKTEHGKRASSSTDTATDHRPRASPASPYQGGVLGAKSPGVQRIEAISAHFTFTDRIFVFIGVFLIAYAYGLDGIIRYTYQVRGLRTRRWWPWNLKPYSRLLPRRHTKHTPCLPRLM
jgi:hypothetical protein